MPVGVLLVGVTDAQQQRLVPPARLELQPDRQAVGREATRHRQAGHLAEGAGIGVTGRVAGRFQQGAILGDRRDPGVNRR